MPPKANPAGEASRKGKGKAKVVNEDVGENFSEDIVAQDAQDGVKDVPVKLDKYMAEFQDLEEEAMGALVGYARCDVLTQNIRFGDYNKRALVQSEKTKLLASFNHNGLGRFFVEHAIPFIIPARRIIEGSVIQLSSLNGARPTDVNLPVLRLNEPDDVVCAAGGRHRRAALEEWVKQKKVLHTAATKVLDEIGSRTKRDPLSVAPEELAEAQEKAYYFQSLVEAGGQWIVAVYNADVVTHAVGLHLSRNQRFYTYAESTEEGIIQTFHLMNSLKKTWRECTVAHGLRPSSHGYKIMSLLQQDYVWKMLEAIVDIPSTHYIHSNIFKITALTNNLMSPIGGLLAAYTIYLERRFELCWNDIPWESDKVHLALETISNPHAAESLKKESDEFLTKCMQTLKEAKPIRLAMNDKIRAKIDGVFKKHLSKPEVARFMGSSASAWQDGYALYVLDVVKELKNVYEEMVKGFEFADCPPETELAWRTAHSKARLVLTNIGFVQEPTFMPFMSVSVWKVLVYQLSRVKKSVAEISSWFSPLVHHHKIIGGNMKIGSHTAEMLRAMCCHPDLNPTLVPMAAKLMVFSFIDMYPALLRMEKELDEISIPARPETTKALKEYFLLEGLPKYTPTWSSGKQKTVARVASDTDEYYLRKELNLEVLILEDLIKKSVKQQVGDKPERAEWLEPWYHAAIQYPPRELQFFRTLNLINSHTVPFGKGSDPSESRIRKSTIVAAVYEYCAIKAYRVKLLSNPLGGAAHVRATLESVVSVAIKGGKRALVPNATTTVLQWPDAVKFDNVTASTSSFNIVTENTLSGKTEVRNEHKIMIAKVIKAVEACPIAWPVPDVADDSSKQSKKPQAVREEITPILESLVKALTLNSYMHREPTLDYENLSDIDVATIPAADNFTFSLMHNLDNLANDDDEDASAPRKNVKKTFLQIMDTTILQSVFQERQAEKERATAEKEARETLAQGSTLEEPVTSQTPVASSSKAVGDDSLEPADEEGEEGRPSAPSASGEDTNMEGETFGDRAETSSAKDTDMEQDAPPLSSSLPDAFGPLTPDDYTYTQPDGDDSMDIDVPTIPGTRHEASGDSSGRVSPADGLTVDQLALTQLSEREDPPESRQSSSRGRRIRPRSTLPDLLSPSRNSSSSPLKRGLPSSAAADIISPPRRPSLKKHSRADTAGRRQPSINRPHPAPLEMDQGEEEEDDPAYGVLSHTMP